MRDGCNGRGQVRASGPPAVCLSVCPGNSTFVTDVTDIDRSERVVLFFPYLGRSERRVLSLQEKVLAFSIFGTK